MSNDKKINNLSDLMSPPGLELLKANGNELVKRIGIDVIRGVVLDVLIGRNLRDATEVLTRGRIAALNLEMVNLFMRGAASSDNFIENLPYLATEILERGRLDKAEKWIAQWMLGLNDKAVQNVLRDDDASLSGYRDRYIQTCSEVIAEHTEMYGELKGEIELDSTAKAQINWLMMTYLLNAVGAETLAIRGSEKSAHGKLFEKLILGSLLNIFGFKFVLPEQADEGEGVFWLSSRGERRESDATLLYEVGRGIRFDIGFIGRGNPEISLDKVTRFESEYTHGQRKVYHMATIILVDRIGKKSRIEEMAKAVDGVIIQMSASYWPQEVARTLNEVLGFEHELMEMDPAQVEEYLKEKLKTVPLEDFINLTTEEPS